MTACYVTGCICQISKKLPRILCRRRGIYFALRRLMYSGRFVIYGVVATEANCFGVEWGVVTVCRLSQSARGSISPRRVPPFGRCLAASSGNQTGPGNPPPCGSNLHAVRDRCDSAMHVSAIAGSRVIKVEERKQKQISLSNLQTFHLRRNKFSFVSKMESIKIWKRNLITLVTVHTRNDVYTINLSVNFPVFLSYGRP